MSATAGSLLTTTPPRTGLGALRDLRARRKRNRLGDLEWFEAAYKVYVAGIFGGVLIGGSRSNDGTWSEARVLGIGRGSGLPPPNQVATAFQILPTV